MLCPIKYTLHEVTSMRDKAIQLPDTGYCNVLVSEIYKLINGYEIIQEIPLIEECETDYPTYVINRIQFELTNHGVCFVEIGNSSGNDKTVTHQFILFNTMFGVIRLESYGKEIIYEVKKQKTTKHMGYILYKGRIVHWPMWKTHLKTLLTIRPGKDRISYWNELFSSKETTDTREFIDIILLK